MRPQPITNQNAPRLLDFVISTKQLKNDAALSRLTGLTPPQVSKLRHRRTRLTGDILLQIHDRTTIELALLRAALAVDAPAASA
jgi:hypothetical protein